MVIELADQTIDPVLNLLQSLLVIEAELVRRLLHEHEHVLNTIKFGWVYLGVHSKLLTALLLGAFRHIPTLFDLKRFLPVFAIHGNHEVLEVVKCMHILRHVLIIKFLANVTL